METNLIQELIALYTIPAKSNHEQEMTKHCIKIFKELGCKVKNKNNNFYITKGKLDEGEYYPCIAAHLDEVHEDRGQYTCYYDSINDIVFGWSYTNKEQCGIGADDKNGIWVALQAAKVLPKLKIALFRGEEIGCVGSREANMNFFKDCRYVLQIDRRNAGDFITSINYNMVSEQFMNDVAPILLLHGYKETSGLMTDVDELCRQNVNICCVNMSCGYYNPHTDQEYTVLHELQNTLEFVLNICNNMTDRYEHKAECSYSRYGLRSICNPASLYGDRYYDYYDPWDDYDNKNDHEPKSVSSLFDEEEEIEAEALRDDLIYAYETDYASMLDVPDDMLYKAFGSDVYHCISRAKFDEVIQQVREELGIIQKEDAV